MYCSFAAPGSDSTTTPAPKKQESLLTRWIQKLTSLLDPVTNFFSGIFNKVLRFIESYMGLIVRMELINIAVGEHVFFEEVASVEKEHHIQAKAIMQLWSDLAWVARFDPLLVNVTDELLVKKILIAKAENSDALANMTIFLFDKFNEKLNDDADVHKAFDEVKSKIASLPINLNHNGNWREKNEKDENAFTAEWHRESMVKRMVLNKMFLYSSKKHTILKKDSDALKRFGLANALLDVVKKANRRKQLQGIYEEALTEAAAELPTADMEWPKALEPLFVKLREKIQKDESLKSALDSVTVNAVTNIGEIDRIKDEYNLEIEV